MENRCNYIDRLQYCNKTSDEKYLKLVVTCDFHIKNTDFLSASNYLASYISELPEATKLKVDFIEDSDVIICCIRNLHDNNLVNKTIKNIKEIYPKTIIFVLNLFQKSSKEYELLEKILLSNSNIFYSKIMPINEEYNQGEIFIQSLNSIFNYFREFNSKLIILKAGYIMEKETFLKLKTNNFKFCYDNRDGLNLSIFCLVPLKMDEFFPIPVGLCDDIPINELIYNHFFNADTKDFVVL